MKFNIFIIFIFTSCTGRMSGFLLMDGQDNTDIGQASVSILKSKDRFRRSWTLKRTTTFVPSSIDAEIHFDGNKLRLILDRVQHLETPSKIFANKNGRLRESVIRRPVGFHLYQDVHNSASIIVHQNLSQTEEMSVYSTAMEGYFRFNDSMYYIAPIINKSSGKGQGHFVTKLSQSVTFDPDVSSSFHGAKLLKKHRPKREVPSIHYEVELMVVADYSMYQLAPQIIDFKAFFETDRNNCYTIRSHVNHARSCTGTNPGSNPVMGLLTILLASVHYLALTCLPITPV